MPKPFVSFVVPDERARELLTTAAKQSGVSRSELIRRVALREAARLELARLRGEGSDARTVRA